MSTEEYFKDKQVFITGATGFLGKLLVEKLLRSFPDIGNIYVLIRPKRGIPISGRLEKYKALAVFDRVRTESPNGLDKLIPVEGDIQKINLGLSDSDRKILVENVNIIYHVAATVRFDEFLHDAILTNVRGTREVANLALELKHVSIFTHVSTVYCNCDRYLIEEKLCSPPVDWRVAIKLVEEYDKETLTTLTIKYIQPFPNTYTFTKSLAENVVNDMCKGQIPTIIARPSIVINTYAEPYPGWNDNFNGPVGLMIATSKGLLRTVLLEKSAEVDYVPADYVVKGIIMGSYQQGIIKNLEDIEVYNISKHKLFSMTQDDLLTIGKKIVEVSPALMNVWYPRFSATNCWYNYYIQVLLFHMVPAFFIDIILRIAGRKPMLFALQRKAFIANCIMKPFMSTTYKVPNDKMVNMFNSLEEGHALKCKCDTFTSQEVFDYSVSMRDGMSKYKLKEKIDPVEAKKRLKWYWYADITLKTIFLVLFLWILIVKFNIFTIIFNRFHH